ncbi:MAG: PP2C family protein-serine/threonine phosphatase [Acidobacteriota bacterium]|nr:PP2C family protein-serine/threonine phosphatase [Acidobacteriota bacterium]
MAGSHSPRQLPAAPDGRSGFRQALLGTLPGRTLILGVGIKLAVALIEGLTAASGGFLSALDTVGSLALIIGLGYFLFRLLALAKRRLLWRVRRKLILSYIFIGVVPALLIVAFFLLCGLLLFYNFSSYLVQSRLRGIEDRALSLARETAVELQRSDGRDARAVLDRSRAILAAEYPDASIAIVPVTRTCAGEPAVSEAAPAAAAEAGPWSHVAPPETIPAWITCQGFSGLLAYAPPAPRPAPGQGATPESKLVIRYPGQPGQQITVGGQTMAGPGGTTHLVVRAVAFARELAPRVAVVVDLPVGAAIRRQLSDETGVEIRGVTALPMAGQERAHPLVARPGVPAEASGGPAGSGGPLNWVTFLDYTDWATGASGPALVSTSLSIARIYDRISSAQARIGDRTFGQALLVALLVVVGGLFLVIEGVALIMGLALAKSITGSVHELFRGTERVRQGDFTHKIAIKARDQLGELADSFNSMTASIEELLRQAAEKKRLEEELRIARQIQMSLLPQGPLLMPGLSVAALCVPAREVGGDYYDFLPLDDHRLGVLIADVSGKGTSAALYMAELKGLVLSLSRIHSSPRQLLIEANRIIAENLDARSFITMTYAVLDLHARTMTYARAGHTPLIYVPGPGAPDRTAEVLAPDGLVLGLKIDDGRMFEQLLKEVTLPLHPGDVFLFFTDGISEAMNEGDDCFGESRLREISEAHANLSSEELRERILREIEAFVGTAAQHDDMTMILLKVEEAGPGQPADLRATARVGA